MGFTDDASVATGSPYRRWYLGSYLIGIDVHCPCVQDAGLIPHAPDSPANNYHGLISVDSGPCRLYCMALSNVNAPSHADMKTSWASIRYIKMFPVEVEED